MASPGEFTAGDVLAAADMNDLPGGVLGYAQVTSIQSSITSETDLTGLSATVDIPASRRVRITGHVRMSGDTADERGTLLIKESTTTLQTSTDTFAIASSRPTMICQAVVTPSSGSHTYKLAMQGVGAATVGLFASSTDPAFILVEDLGPA